MVHIIFLSSGCLLNFLLPLHIYFAVRTPDPVMTMGPGHEPNVGMFIEEHKKRADSDPNAPPFDDLRNYAYEGGGSTAGSLSSLQSGKCRIVCWSIFIISGSIH